MPRIHAQRLPRTLYRQVRTRRERAEEKSFQTALRRDPQAPQLLLSPHFDDAVLGCWERLSSAEDVKVVNVFAGAPAPGTITFWDSITGAHDSAERVRERVAEDRRALALAQREPVNLPLLDTQYRTGEPPSLRGLDGLVAETVGRISSAWAPAGLGAHPDHLIVRRYARMLARARIPVFLYAELPYCIVHGWPHWVDGSEPDPHRNVDLYWQSFLAGVPEMPELRSAHVECLDASSAAAKLEAMRSYETQFPALDAGRGGLLSAPAIHGFEVRWELAGGTAELA